MTNKKQEHARLVFEQFGPIVRTGILRENKLFSRDIAELIAMGHIRKLKTGVYVRRSSEDSLTDLEVAAGVIPGGIVCLQSAADYYNLTTLNPTAVTIAIPANSMRPVLPDYPPIELVPAAPALFELGLSMESASSLPLRIYDRERTVCDFFKKRGALGGDLAMEVLKNYMNGKRRLQVLFEYAQKLRVKSVIRPYVEALL